MIETYDDGTVVLNVAKDKKFVIKIGGKDVLTINEKDGLTVLTNEKL